VYLPQDSHICISQRIEDEAERKSCARSCKLLLPRAWRRLHHRTMAETASEREMRNRPSRYLTKLWSDLTARALEVPAPTLLYQDLSAGGSGCCANMATRKPPGSSSTRAETYTRFRVRARVHAGAHRAHPASPPESDRCSISTASRTRSRKALARAWI